MSKLIIHIEDGDEQTALECVSTVIERGRISTSPMGDQFCYITRLNNGTIIAARKPSSKTDTFHVFKDSREEQSNE